MAAFRLPTGEPVPAVTAREMRQIDRVAGDIDIHIALEAAAR